MADDGLTENELESFASKAAYLYLENEADWGKTAKVLYPRYPEIASLPRNTVVGDVLDKYNEEKIKYDKYVEARNKSREKFIDHLEKVSKGRVKRFSYIEPSVSVKVNWGHNHGTHIEYSSNDSDLNYDYSSVLDNEDTYF